MAEIVDRLIGLVAKYWRHHRARWLFPAAAALLLLVYITDYGKVPIWLGHVALAAFLALICYAFWTWDNRVPRIARNNAGIVLALTCDDDDHDRQVRADFVGALRQLLQSDQANTRFQFLDLPRHHASACVDHDSASRMLARAHGHLLLYGSVRKRMVNSELSHLVALEGVVRTAIIGLDVSRQIVADFRAVLPRRVQFGVNNDAFAFEVTSEWAEMAVRYVIAMAALASGDVWYAERLLLSVEQHLRQGAARIAPVRSIIERLPARFETLYARWLEALYTAYFLTRRREFLEALEEVAQKLLARNPSHYQALLQLAISRFVLHGDVAGAKRAISACRRIRDVTWRYSLAFLLAYEGNTRRAREEYREAFQGRLSDPTIPVQCEEFIHLVLAEEPDKAQLLFFAGQIK